MAGALHFLLAESMAPSLVLVLLSLLSILAGCAVFGLTFVPALYLRFTGWDESPRPTHDSIHAPPAQHSSPARQPRWAARARRLPARFARGKC